MNSLPEGLPGKALALGILAVLLAALYLVTVQPLLQLYDAQAQTLQERTELAARLQRTANALPKLRESAETWRKKAREGDLLLEGARDAVAAAALQSTVKGLVSQGGATLASAEILAGTAEGKYQRVGIRVSLSGDLSVLTTVLRGISEAHPVLFVDNMEIRSQGGGAEGEAEHPLTIALDVYGFRAL
jgi:hypothetical protein